MRVNAIWTVLLTLLVFFTKAEADDAVRTMPPCAIEAIGVRRCETNPSIDFQSSPTLGHNINGPSVIRVPSWIKDPLGKYYMYFAHHGGKFIRLAYADSLQGPWRIYEPGSLRLEQATAFHGHIASPDVHVDQQKQEIRMYFHGPARGGQKTGVATSRNGIDFVPSDVILGQFYFRVFQWNGWYYAIAKNGNSGWGTLYRSKDGFTPFESRGDFIQMIRHAAVMIEGDQLLVFYSRAQDAPERIVVATVMLTDDWNDWQASEPIDVIRPEKDYEGIGYPNKPSRYGSATNVRQLRDPCIFREDGKTYLFYSVAGEMGIAMGELEIKLKSNSERTSDPLSQLSAGSRE